MKIPCLFGTSFCDAIRKGHSRPICSIQKQFITNLFFPNSRSKVPFSSALILFKLRKYQFLRNTGSLLQGLWFNIGFSEIKLLNFSKKINSEDFFFEDLKRRFMSKIGILGYIQLEERFEITPYSRVPNCGIFGNRSRL